MAAIQGFETLPPIQLENNQQYLADEASFITAGKVKKVALGILGVGSALLTAGLIFTTYSSGNFIPLIASMGTGFISYVFFRALGRVKDYEDPKCLESYRKQALSQSLEKTAQEHSWEKMFHYGIPLPQDFANLYRLEAEKRSFNDLIQFNQKLKEEAFYHQNPRYPYQIPDLKEHAYKFEGEILNLTPCEVYDKFNINKLHSLGVLDIANAKHQALLKHVKDFSALSSAYKAKLKDIQDEYEKNIHLPYTQYLTTKASIDHAEKLRKKYNDSVRARRTEHTVDYLLDTRGDLVRGVRFWGDFIWGDETQSGDLNMQTSLQAQHVFEEQIAPFKKQAEEKINLVQTWYQSERSTLNALINTSLSQNISLN